MVIIKPSFSLIFCCFLFIFFPQRIVSHKTAASVHKPGSPGAPRCCAKETSHTSSQVDSATLRHEKQRNP
ncbi:hypothetical protein V6N13_026125 [Hibiscus sabdariffa]|uniref:Secreted protein n=2 Tax=Hibiscus sabdariffa TaxID=183260 RepID=A0ABR2AQ38_9ROSI